MRTIAAFLAVSLAAAASPIVTQSLNATLTTGSLSGVSFPVSFSYDAGQIQPMGDSFIALNSFDFTLLGVPFNRSQIFQGGQVIFRNGILDNVTASYQVTLPPMAPVRNITFGFGGPGIIGYIDLNGAFGGGAFTFTSNSVPEPSTFAVMAASLCIGLIYRRRTRLAA